MKEMFKRAWKRLKTHKKAVIGTSVFAGLGLIGLLIGFEIEQDGHAIRNFISSPHFATAVIITIASLIIFVIVLTMILGVKDGGKYDK